MSKLTIQALNSALAQLRPTATADFWGQCTSTYHRQDGVWEVRGPSRFDGIEFTDYSAENTDKKAAEAEVARQVLYSWDPVVSIGALAHCPACKVSVPTGKDNLLSHWFGQEHQKCCARLGLTCDETKSRAVTGSLRGHFGHAADVAAFLAHRRDFTLKQLCSVVATSTRSDRGPRFGFVSAAFRGRWSDSPTFFTTPITCGDTHVSCFTDVKLVDWRTEDRSEAPVAERTVAVAASAWLGDERAASIRSSPPSDAPSGSSMDEYMLRRARALGFDQVPDWVLCDPAAISVFMRLGEMKLSQSG